MYKQFGLIVIIEIPALALNLGTSRPFSFPKSGDMIYRVSGLHSILASQPSSGGGPRI